MLQDSDKFSELELINGFLILIGYCFDFCPYQRGDADVIAVAVLFTILAVLMPVICLSIYGTAQPSSEYRFFLGGLRAVLSHIVGSNIVRAT